MTAPRCPARSARTVILAALAALLLAAWPALAQAPADADPAARIAAAERTVRQAGRALDGDPGVERRRALRETLLSAQAALRGGAGALSGELELAQARLEGLGTPVAGIAEAPDVARERARLEGEAATLDAAVRRARLLEVEAQQYVEQIGRIEAEQFGETLSQRRPSPLSPGFWAEVARALPGDLDRIRRFGDEGGRQIERQWRGQMPWPALLSLLAALAVLGPARAWGHRLGLRHIATDAPGHRVRRSANALWRTVLGTVAPLVAAAILVQGLRWSDLLPERWSGVLDAFIGAAAFAGFTAAVTGAVLMRGRPGWRIPRIGDDVAARLRPFSFALATLSFVTLMLGAFNEAVDASLPARMAAEAMLALAHLLLIGAFLLVLGGLRGARADAEAVDATAAGAGLGLMNLVAWGAFAVGLGALLLGFTPFSLFVGQLLAWTTVLGCTLYLAMHAADDLATTMLSRRSRIGMALIRALGIRPSRLDQAGLLLSGLLRVTLVIVAIGLLVTPFGGGGGIGSLSAQLGAVAAGGQVAGVPVSPGAILRGLLVLAFGLLLVRGFMAWLETRYLPATDLDFSGRNSVSLVARYVGIALAAIWALASLGIGVERIAILLSALSVGIGFGLQAITSNFVSGLILLAERPIRIGDLIRVGTDEGDVRRISVRSTEIALADHSTLIVPNSELITKTVLNKTRANPLGRVQVAFSVPIETEAAAVRQVILDAFAAEPTILADPAPSVFIEGIRDGRILFSGFAHVESPRAAYGARSGVLMTILTELRARNIEVGTMPQRVELAPAPRGEGEPN